MGSFPPPFPLPWRDLVLPTVAVVALLFGICVASVGMSCRTALNYIKTSFQVKCPQLKALTTQGSLLPSLAFRAEVTEMVRAC